MYIDQRNHYNSHVQTMATMYEKDHESALSTKTASNGYMSSTMPTVTVKSVSSISIDEEKDAGTSNIIQTPLDSGKAAYTVLLACFLIQSATAGIPLAFGVFEDYYSTRYVNFETASWIGVLSEGLPYAGAPLMTICCQKLSIPRQVYIIVGVVLCALSHLASAFITSLPGLIATQGCVFGIGSLLTEIPSLVILDTHFEKRRGLAYGIVFGGADLAGIAYAFLATYLLERQTYRITMIVFASVIFVVALTAVCLLKERKVILPDSEVTVVVEDGDAFIPKPLTRAKPLVPPTTIRSGTSFRRNSQVNCADQKKYYQQPIFYFLNLSNVILAIAASLPWIYLPTFSSDMGYSKSTGALILSLCMLFQFLGEVVFGTLSDKIDVSLLVIATMSVSGISTLILWGMFGYTTLATLLAYACFFGGFSAGYLALWSRMGTLFGEDDSTMVYSILSTGKGAGVILSGPISQSLLTRPSAIRLGSKNHTRWGAMIVYVGSCTSVSALMGVLAFLAGIPMGLMDLK